MSNAKTMNFWQALWSGPSGVKSNIQQTGHSVGTINLRSAHTVSNRRLGSSHLLADVLSGESTAALSAFETSDVPLPLQSQQRLTLFDLLATAGTVYNTEEDKDRVRAVPTLLVRPLSNSSSSLPESLPDGASRSRLQDDPRRRLACLHVCRKLQGMRPQRAACGHRQPSRLLIVEGNKQFLRFVVIPYCYSCPYASFNV